MAAGGQPLAVRAEGGGPDLIAVANQIQQSMAARHVPQLYSSIAARRRQQLVVGTEGNRIDTGEMAGDRQHIYPSGHIPNHDSTVKKAGAQHSPIGTECNRSNVIARVNLVLFVEQVVYTGQFLLGSRQSFEKAKSGHECLGAG